MSFSHLRPTLRQLEYLVAVADERSFSRAATKCHVTQPSLSSQIRQLELVIGDELFERTSRGVLITPKGSELVELARAAIESADRFLERALDRAEVASTSLRIGCVSTITPYLMPQVLAELSADAPELRIELVDGAADVLKEGLLAGELDALVASIPTELGGCEEIELAWDPFVLVAPSGSELGDRSEPVPLSALRQARLLLLDDPHCFGGEVLEFCQRARSAPDESIHATSISALTQMVRRGLGATLLPTLALTLELAWLSELKVKRLEDPSPGRTIGLTFRRGSQKAAALRTLGSVAMRHAESAVLTRPS